MNSKSNVILLDFNDSFTFNVASELYKLDILAEVIAKKDILEKLETITRANKKCVVIYGPGPGHPDEYAQFFPIIKKALENPKIFHFGICLGHQLLWQVKGFKVIPSKIPIHGQRFKFKIPKWSEFEQNIWDSEIDVQRYNSLVVDSSKDGDFSYHQEEVVAGRFNRGVSFQFHPESVGTTNPSIFFKSIINFLMESNKKVEYESIN